MQFERDMMEMSMSLSRFIGNGNQEDELETARTIDWIMGHFPRGKRRLTMGRRGDLYIFIKYLLSSTVLVLCVCGGVEVVWKEVGDCYI